MRTLVMCACALALAAWGCADGDGDGNGNGNGGVADGGKGADGGSDTRTPIKIETIPGFWYATERHDLPTRCEDHPEECSREACGSIKPWNCAWEIIVDVRDYNCRSACLEYVNQKIGWKDIFKCPEPNSGRPGDVCIRWKDLSPSSSSDKLILALNPDSGDAEFSWHIDFPEAYKTRDCSDKGSVSSDQRGLKIAFTRRFACDDPYTYSGDPAHWTYRKLQ